MNTQINSLNPANIAAYLSARGWRRAPSFVEAKASLWLAPGKSETDVLLPLRANLGDYSLRMGALVDTVASVEGRSPYEVLRDFSTISADLIRVRIAADGPSGTTLPFIDGVNLLKKIRDVLVAAALSTLEKRAYYTNRWPEMIVEFLDQLELGQTEYSSFVFTVVSPLDGEQASLPRVGGDRADRPQEPFGRRVAVTLMHALKAMEDAAAAAALEGNVNPFLLAVEEGVSANLCDAVVELQSIVADRSVEFSVTWAATREPPEDAVHSVVLAQDRIPQIEAASDAIWGMPKRFDFRLEGTVLEMDPARGAAILLGYVDGKPRRIRANLDALTSAEADRAQRERLLIRCEGDLVREGGELVLKTPRYFQILDDGAKD